MAPHYGGYVEDAALGRTIDSRRNILSNKLSAVFRYEAKDIVDILTISKHEKFNWMDVVQEAKTKEAAVDPVSICEILKSFPENLLDTIKWTTPVKYRAFKKELTRIAEDILRGRDNTLAGSLILK